MIIRTSNRAMTEAEIRYQEHRVSYLPKQVEGIRRRLKAIENEARRYNMIELASDVAHVNAAWDEAIDDGRARFGFPDVTPEPKQ